MRRLALGPAEAGYYALRAPLLLLIAFGVGILQTPAIKAQNPQGAPSVTFQVEVNYVDVDTVVTDEKGNFITGLTRDDFEVFEDGKPQKIDMFSFVEIPVEKGTPFLVANRPVVGDSQSNRQPFAGRVYVIVLDDLDVSMQRTVIVKKSARQFVEQYMGANDMAAIVYTSGRTDASQEFTGNKQLLYAAIDRFVGRRLRSLTLERLDRYYSQLLTSTQQGQQDSEAPPTDPGAHSRMEPGDVERGFRAIGVLDTLKNVSEFLANVRGRRKAVIFFSEGIDYPIHDVFGGHSASDVIRATQDAITMAARSNVNYFTVDPRGLVGMTSEFMEMQGSGSPGGAGAPEFGTPGTNAPTTGYSGAVGPMSAQQELMNELQVSQGSLRTLAEETGGIAAVNSNMLTTAFERIVEANSRYYVLGYYPPNHPRDGRFHKISVRVKNRPELKVLARKGYGAPRGRTAEERQRDEAAKRARDAKKPDGDKTSDTLRNVLQSPMQQSGLSFTVQAAPFKNTPKDASVALAIDLDGDRLQFAPPNEKGLFANVIELSFYSLSDQGKGLAGTRTALDLTLRPETLERVKAHGVRVNPRINLPPGRYQVRVGARDTVGSQTGSVYYDLEVPEFRQEKVMMGGLLIASNMSQQTPSIQPDPVVAKLLPGAATSRREFSRNDLLAVYTEIYDNLNSRQPRRFDVAARLLSESGTEVFVSREEISNGAVGEKPWEIYGYGRQIPLKGVDPGRYLLRVEAQVRGNLDNAKPAARETLITILP